MDAPTPLDYRDAADLPNNASHGGHPGLPWPRAPKRMEEEHHTGCTKDQQAHTSERILCLGKCLVVAPLPSFFRQSTFKLASGVNDGKHTTYCPQRGQT